MIPALLAPILFLAQGDLSQPITLKVEPARMSVLVRQLSEKVKVPLLTSPQTENDIVLISVTDVPASEVMKRLADVSYSEWQKEGDGYRLVRGTQQLREANSVDVKARAVRVQTALGLLAKEQSTIPPWTDKTSRQLADRYLAHVKASKAGSSGDSEAFDKAMAQSPIERAMPEILQLIGPQTLAEIAPGRRVVFSLTPNQAQRALPQKAAGIIREMVRRQALFSEEYRKIKPEDGSEYSFGKGDPKFTGKPNLGPGKVLLIGTGNLGHTSFRLIVADTEGATMVESYYGLMTTTPDPAESASKKVELPAETLALAKAVVDSGSGYPVNTRGSMKMMSNGPDGPLVFETAGSPNTTSGLKGVLREKALRPDEYEPLSFVAGPSIAALSNTKNVIGVLPDPLFNALAYAIAPGDITDAKLRRAFRLGDTEIASAGDWTTVKPIFPAVTIQRRVNRTGLATVLGRLSSQGYLTLSDVCQFAISQPGPVTASTLESSYLSMINSGVAMRAIEMLAAPAILRIYGTLSDVQRSGLISQRSLSLRGLSTQQRAWLTDEVYNLWDGTSVSGRDYQYGGEQTLANERTEAMPNGIPIDAAISLEVYEEPVLYGLIGSSGTIVRTAALASHRYQVERVDLQTYGVPPTYERFQPAKEATYSFNIDLTPKVRFGRMAYDTWVDRKVTPMAYEALPLSIREAADKTLERFRKTFGHMEDGKLIPPQ